MNKITINLLERIIVDLRELDKKLYGDEESHDIWRVIRDVTLDLRDMKDALEKQDDVLNKLLRDDY